MPKIDWADEDQPRWEPRYRPRRERSVRSPARVAAILNLARDERDVAPARRPLHLIWGEPRRDVSPPAPSP